MRHLGGSWRRILNHWRSLDGTRSATFTVLLIAFALIAFSHAKACWTEGFHGGCTTDSREWVCINLSSSVNELCLTAAVIHRMACGRGITIWRCYKVFIWRSHIVIDNHNGILISRLIRCLFTALIDLAIQVTFLFINILLSCLSNSWPWWAEKHSICQVFDWTWLSARASWSTVLHNLGSSRTYSILWSIW
jgi:hypothetical protein